MSEYQALSGLIDLTFGIAIWVGLFFLGRACWRGFRGRKNEGQA